MHANKSMKMTNALCLMNLPVLLDFLRHLPAADLRTVTVNYTRCCVKWICTTDKLECVKCGILTSGFAACTSFRTASVVLFDCLKRPLIAAYRAKCCIFFLRSNKRDIERNFAKFSFDSNVRIARSAFHSVDIPFLLTKHDFSNKFMWFNPETLFVWRLNSQLNCSICLS